MHCTSLPSSFSYISLCTGKVRASINTKCLHPVLTVRLNNCLYIVPFYFHSVSLFFVFRLLPAPSLNFIFVAFTSSTSHESVSHPFSSLYLNVLGISSCQLPLPSCSFLLQPSLCFILLLPSFFLLSLLFLPPFLPPLCIHTLTQQIIALLHLVNTSHSSN